MIWWYSASVCSPLAASTCQASGTTSGSKMPIVPQLVPVAKAVAADRTNTRAGTSPGASRSLSTDDRYWAVRNSSVMDESAQANSRMIIAKNMERSPAYQASIVSSSVRIRCPIDSAAAESTPSSEPHISARYESALPMISRSVSPSPVAYSPPSTETNSTRIGMSALRARCGLSSGGRNSRPSAAASSMRAPAPNTWPVVRARSSARYIGPKSRCVQATANTNRSASQG